MFLHIFCSKRNEPWTRTLVEELSEGEWGKENGKR